MIQFNLLPDIKLEFIKAQRLKRAVTSAALIATVATAAIFVLLFVAVHVVQSKIMSNQTSDIKKYNTQLANTSDLDKILTIQNQLAVLPSLHADKPSATRTFDLIKKMTPTDVSLTDVTVDFEAKTFSISGVSKTLDQVNTMADSIKYTSYSTSDVSNKKVFSGVALSQYTRNSDSTTFTITANYDEAIYDNAAAAIFTVPTVTSTQSVANQPNTNLFTKTTNGSN